MSESITRRTFIKGSTALGVTSILGGSIAGWIHKPAFAATEIDIAAVTGLDYFKSTIRAVELLGGMGKFVAKHAKVGLLINSPWDKKSVKAARPLRLARRPTSKITTSTSGKATCR